MVAKEPIDDLAILSDVHTDHRLSGIQLCTSEPKYKGYLTGLRLVTAEDFGEGDLTSQESR